MIPQNKIVTIILIIEVGCFKYQIPHFENLTSRSEQAIRGSQERNEKRNKNVLSIYLDISV